jgi:uncharacterized protein (DUF427 family)
VKHPRPDAVGPGQESVWSYPRPPSAQVTARRIVVELAGRVVADTVRAVRVCETSHPPVYYVPREDIADGVLERAAGSSWCEWKGSATYWDLASATGTCRRPAGPTRTRRRATSSCVAPSPSTRAGSIGHWWTTSR